MLSPRPFIVSAALTTIAIGYRNESQTLIADDIFPIVEVPGPLFKYREYPLAQAFSFPDNKVGSKGSVEEIDIFSNEKTESVVDYALKHRIPYTWLDDAASARKNKLSTYNPENDAAQMLADGNLLARELRVAKKTQDPNSYAVNRRMVLSGSSMFSDPNSDPIGIIDDAIDGTFLHRANILQMGFSVWKVLKKHPKIIKAIRGNFSGDGLVTKQELAELFSVKKIVVGESFLNVSRPGQAPTISRVWGNSLSALFVNPLARAENGVTFGLTGKFGASFAGYYEHPDVGMEGGREIRVGDRMVEFSPAKDVGFLIQNAV
jgi:hypothetical protein